MSDSGTVLLHECDPIRTSECENAPIREGAQSLHCNLRGLGRTTILEVWYRAPVYDIDREEGGDSKIAGLHRIIFELGIKKQLPAGQSGCLG